MSAIHGAPPVLLDLGAHVSAAGRLELCFGRGDELGARTLQIFLKNQLQWKARPLGDYEVGCFRKAQRASGVRQVVAHATYLINLATEDATLRGKSVACLGHELQCAAALGLGGVVVHAGSHPDPAAGVARAAGTIEAITLNPDSAGAPLLLENAAGQGDAIGARLEELEAILKALLPGTAERVGICLDTCHLHAAGYDVSSGAAWRALIDEVSERVGLDRLRAIHVNDSVGPRGSRLDRHANLGEGTIGIEGFRGLLEEERLLGIPKVLETPQEGDGYRRDLELLRRLAGG